MSAVGHQALTGHQGAVAMTKLLSVREVAQRLGISGALVYALCLQRRLRHERHGLGRGTIRIPEEAIEEYRASVTVGRNGGTAGPSPTPKRPTPALKHLALD
jgi:excisionase family DNA binding protein